MQELEYNVLHNKVDALNDVVKNNEETQVLLFLWYIQGFYYFLQHKGQNLTS